MRFGEFKSGLNQPIDPAQGVNHREAIVRRAHGSTTGVNPRNWAGNLVFHPNMDPLERQAVEFIFDRYFYVHRVDYP